MQNENFKKINGQNSKQNNKDLHRIFVKLSFDIIKMKNKLISLLLEIYEQKIYKNYSCLTIYEYAFKYAKLSKEVVDKAVRTLKHLENKPCLKGAIETQGIHKVALVATIATPETDAAWADKLKNMSKPAVQELSKEVRYKMENGDCVNQNLFGEKSASAENANCKTSPCSAAHQ
ncbi:hypothetical protein HZA40_02375 [Candidatus Peregrinibacteria bacterium]|nr:hypothetical protein [Candidatus Peregrinibacteria bacterium]